MRKLDTEMKRRQTRDMRKFIRNAVLRGRQGILERYIYILEMYFRLSDRCRQARKIIKIGCMLVIVVSKRVEVM